MSLFDFGSGAEGQARRGMRTSRWMPGTTSFGGFNVAGTRTNGNKGPVNYTGGFDPEQSALRTGFLSMLQNGMGQLQQPLANNGGYGGVSDQLLGEMNLANQQSGELPPQFYDQAGFDQGLGNAREGADMAWQEYQNLAGSGDAGYSKWLDLMRSSSRDQENRFMQGGMDDQFMKGILASTAGQYQTQGMMDSIENADIQRQLQSFGMSQEALNGAMGRATSAQGMYNGMEGDAANRGFMLNQLKGSNAQDRFARAMSMFGTGMDANNFTRQNATQLLGLGAQGMQSQDQMLMSMLGLTGNLAAQRSGANAGAASILANTNAANLGNWAGIIGSSMQGAGAAAVGG
jgi:hypothetical protein